MLKTARQHGVGNAWERNPLRGAASDSLRLYDNLYSVPVDRHRKRISIRFVDCPHRRRSSGSVSAEIGFYQIDDLRFSAMGQRRGLGPSYRPRSSIRAQKEREPIARPPRLLPPEILRAPPPVSIGLRSKVDGRRYSCQPSQAKAKARSF